MKTPLHLSPRGGSQAHGSEGPSPSPSGPALWQSLLPACLSPAPAGGGPPPGEERGAGGGGGAAAQQERQQPRGGTPVEGWDPGEPGSDCLPRGRRVSWGSGRNSWPASLASPRAPGGGGGGGAAGHAQQAGIELAHAPASPQRGGGSGDGGGGGGRMRAWQVLWRSEHQQHSLTFEATQDA
jgi:hypothetical protein